MNKYESVIIANSKLDEETRQAVVNKIEKSIKDNGTLESTENKGKKKLAYPIKDNTEAYYYYTDIELKIGNIVYAPTKYGDKKSMVAEFNIPEDKINTTLKTIVEKIEEFGYSQGVA